MNNSASFDGAICTLQNTVLSFNGTNNFINNSAHKGVGGAICSSHNSVLSFNGTTHLSATQQFILRVEQFMHWIMLHVTSMEPPTLSRTQQTVMVVQFVHQTMLYLASWETTILAAIELTILYVALVVNC